MTLTVSLTLMIDLTLSMHQSLLEPLLLTPRMSLALVCCFLANADTLALM